MHRRPRVVLACLLSFAALGLSFSSQAYAAPSPADRMIAKINSVRAANGLPPLRQSPSLDRSSHRFSAYLMSRDLFGHRSRVSASRHFRRLGEALAMHSGHRLAIRGTVREWLGSPEHRAIVLTRSMRWIGAGATRGRFQGRGATIWVLQAGG